ncbi:MAG: DNA polymerase I [Oscillospiraceae bacterium]|nr:DNA polymerase I [Oscillospiraceae bacterium]
MKLMVIDGNSIVNRAFYGVRPLSTRDGLYTHAVYGFLTILQKLTGEEKPDALCVTFDRKEPTFRHLAYEGYKAQRKGMPEELAMQMPVLKEVLDAMNIPRYELAGWEADDLIGTIAARDTAAGWETVIVTGDRDSLQLVTDTARVKLVTTRMGQTTTKDMTPGAFRAEYGFDPIHIIDLKALMGDTSDNIPGVKGVGEKTAMALIQLYHSIDHLYGHMPDICMAPDTPAKPGVVKKLTEGAADARMSYDLARIHCDAPLDFDPEQNRCRPVNGPALYELFLKLEFSKLIDKMGLKPGPGGAAPHEGRKLGMLLNAVITRSEDADRLLEGWRGLDHVSVLVLPGLNGFVAAWDDDGTHRAATFFSSELSGYNRILRDFFSSEDIKKVSHNVKDLMRALMDEGIQPAGFVFDTAIAAYLMAPTDGSYDLEKLSVSYFNRELMKAEVYQAEDAFGPLSDPAMPTMAMLQHAGLIEALYEELSPRLDGLGMRKLFDEVEMPLCPVLAEIERAGFLVDAKALRAFGDMLSDGIKKAQDEIYELAGGPFNINSTKQLGTLLFETLGLPPMKKTKTGYSTNAEVLEKLKGEHPVIERILEYRQLTKLNSTYVEGLTKVIAPDGRIHTSFQNTVTATGRLSSMEPNLQNIPVRTPLGAEMRKMFVAGPGNVLVDADYSQIELRLLAHISDDKEMQKAFLTGVDVHTVTASQVFGVPVEEVTRRMRSSAKAVNFGIVYGISQFSLSQDIGVSVAEAKDYMERYFAHYAGVRAYMTDIVVQAKKDGFVSTLLGRRRWLPELKSSNFNTRSFGERVALNMPVQGTAADLIKLAMVRVQARLKAAGLAGRLVLQVHDELIVECPEAEAEQVEALLAEEMEGVAKLAVPLTADAHAGKSWADAH